MPDVMTPESMVSKLDEFENFKEGEEPAKKETDVSLRLFIIARFTKQEN